MAMRAIVVVFMLLGLILVLQMAHNDDEYWFIVGCNQPGKTGVP